MKLLNKLSQIQIEFTSDEVNALKYILESYQEGCNGDYRGFVNELLEMIK